MTLDGFGGARLVLRWLILGGCLATTQAIRWQQLTAFVSSMNSHPVRFPKRNALPSSACVMIAGHAGRRVRLRCDESGAYRMSLCCE